MRTDLAETIWPKARREIIGLLFTRPDDEWHLRDIARRIDLAPATVHREVVSLSDAGILNRRTVGNQVLYSANRSCPIFDELRGIAVKTTGLADVIRDALSDLSGRIEAAFIFGSFAAGEDRPDSDVDVMIVGELRLTDLVPQLRRLETGLGREVNPITMSAREFGRRAAENEHFVRRVLKEPKVFLFGDEDDLERIAGGGQASQA